MDWEKRTEIFLNEYYQRGKEDKRVLIEKLVAYTKDENKYIVYFGCGVQGQTIFQQLLEYGIKPTYFCDNNPKLHGKEIIIGSNIKCISLEQLSIIKDNAIVILTVGLNYANQIYNQLKTLGINNLIKYPIDSLSINSKDIYKFESTDILVKMKKLYSILMDEKSKEVAFFKLKAMLLPLDEMNSFDFQVIYSEPQYYPPDIIVLQDKEVIIEGGSYNGDSADYLINIMKYTGFKRYYCYELDEDNYKDLSEYIDKLEEGIKEKFILHNAGLSNKCETLHYSAMGEGSNLSGELCSGETKKCRVVSIDESITDDVVTFIKMDIEGSEIDALNGAQKIIYRDKPKLAICVYHKASHLWEVPLLIKTMVPEYKLYLRHHTLITTDTVCYAIM